jgi:hypothetical protein
MSYQLLAPADLKRRRKRPRFSFDRRFDGPQNRSGREENPCLRQGSNPGRPALKPWLYRLSYPGIQNKFIRYITSNNKKNYFRWLPTGAARVRVRAACGVCGWTKRHWGRFSPSTSVSPANHSTDFSIIIITRS